MNEKKKQSVLQKKWFSWLLQIIFFCLFFIAFSWWQQKNMLSHGKKIEQSNFNLLTVNNEYYSYTIDNGKTDTLIYFFSPWCKICHLSIDNLEDIYQSKSGELTILVVALSWQSLEEVQVFVAKHGLSMPVLLGTKQIEEQFQISAFPSYYLLSKDGKVLSKDVGYSTKIGLNARLKINRYIH